MVVEADKAIKRKIGDRTYYFCSESCARTYEQPEQELKNLKRRVTITLLGVISVATLRLVGIFLIAGFFEALMVFRVAGIITPWNLAFFVISTSFTNIGSKSVALATAERIASSATL